MSGASIDGRLERFPSVLVAVFLDFENLVYGAGTGVPDRASPVPYAAITHLCRDYGQRAIRRAP